MRNLPDARPSPDLATISDAFTRTAERYDSFAIGHPHLTRMREKVYSIFARHVAVGARVLELNAGTGTDAVALAKGFASFDSKDLQNLGTGEAVCRLERGDGDFNLRVPLPDEPDAERAAATRQQVVASSRNKYATARAEVEAIASQTEEHGLF